MTTRGGYDTEALEEILGEMVDKHKCGCYVEGEWFVYEAKPYGYLYCFSNPSMEGILKIGMTKRNPEERLKEANKSDTWKPPTDYELLSSVKCYEPEKKEKLLHKLLDEYRINKNREFFRVDEEKVNIIFKMLDIEEFEDKYECRNNKIKTEKEKNMILNWFDDRIIEYEEWSTFDELYDDWESYWDDEGVNPKQRPEKKRVKEILLEMQSKTCYGLILGKKRSDCAPNGTKIKPKFNFKIKEDEKYEAEEYVVDGMSYMKVWDDEDKIWVIVDPETSIGIGFPDGNGGISRKKCCFK